jgi:polyhydroxyalkanoate synthesis repressor PhaR
MNNELVNSVIESKLPSQSEEKVTVFKRYPNRKLYDPSVSSYVTLKDIFKLVKDNKKVQIINNQTKEDITNSVLLNALVEDRKGHDDTQVASMLKHLAGYINEGENNG